MPETLSFEEVKRNLIERGWRNKPVVMRKRVVFTITDPAMVVGLVNPDVSKEDLESIYGRVLHKGVLNAPKKSELENFIVIYPEVRDFGDYKVFYTIKGYLLASLISNVFKRYKRGVKLNLMPRKGGVWFAGMHGVDATFAVAPTCYLSISDYAYHPLYDIKQGRTIEKEEFLDKYSWLLE